MRCRFPGLAPATGNRRAGGPRGPTASTISTPRPALRPRRCAGYQHRGGTAAACSWRWTCPSRSRREKQPATGKVQGFLAVLVDVDDPRPVEHPAVGHRPSLEISAHPGLPRSPAQSHARMAAPAPALRSSSSTQGRNDAPAAALSRLAEGAYPRERTTPDAVDNQWISVDDKDLLGENVQCRSTRSRLSETGLAGAKNASSHSSLCHQTRQRRRSSQWRRWDSNPRLPACKPSGARPVWMLTDTYGQVTGSCRQQRTRPDGDGCSMNVDR